MRSRAFGLFVGWRIFSSCCFALLCLRFVLAIFLGGQTDTCVAAALFTGPFLLGYFRSHAALFAFTALMLILNGLSQSTFFPLGLGPSFVFSAIYLGLFVRRSIDAIRSVDPAPASRICSLQIVVEAIALAVIASLAIRIWTSRYSMGFWHVLFGHTILGFGDPFYFLTSAFLWLQGLFFFQELSRLNEDGESSGKVLHDWMRPVFQIYATTIGVFLAFQFITNIPQPLEGFAYFLPCEDISSFGSICVTVYAYFVALAFGAQGRWRTWAPFGGVALVGVVASWSRGTWLSAMLISLAVAFVRLPLRKRLMTTAVAIFALGVLCSNSNREAWLRIPYVSRLLDLVRIENPLKKSPERIFLYKKAFAMIRNRPLTGYGIGSFYRASTGFAQTSDPNGSTPDFAHDMFLEVAAELGIPVAVLLGCLTVCAIYRGLKSGWTSGASGSSSALFLYPPRLETGCAACALACYVETQFTANSVNVYPSNQFLFWTLIAFLWHSNRSENSVPR